MQNGRKVTVILDGSHHGMRLLFGCKKEETPEEAFQLWRYYYLNGIFNYIQEFKVDEFIIALDSRKNWRKKIFPYYKAHRKLIRKEQDEDDTWFTYDLYYKEYDKLMDEISKNFPIKVLKVEATEADDIAGVLCCKEELSENIKILITTDADYNQLLTNNLVKIYNPIKKEFVRCDNPKDHLYRKILMGDKGDFVPSVKDRRKFKPEFLQYCVNHGVAKNETNAKIILENDEELTIKLELQFQQEIGIKPSTVYVFSKKIINGLLQNNQLKSFLDENEDVKKNFIRNNKLVNLTAQPKVIKEAINDAYDNYEYNNNTKGIFNYFVMNKFNDFLDNVNTITKTLKPLCDEQK